MKYTKEDIIIFPDDERLPELIDNDVFSSEPIVYTFDSPYQAYKAINENSDDLVETGYACECKLVGLYSDREKGDESRPFECMLLDDIYENVLERLFSTECIILKKEPKNKLEQLDFDIKEDREMLRGKTLIHDNPLRPGDKEECEVKGFFYDASDERWKVVIADLWGNCAAYCEQNLFWGFVFMDTGLPVGKEVL